MYYRGAYYRSEPRDTEVDVQSVTTNAAGEASVEFTPPSAGTYRLVAESTDDQGRVARSARFLWVTGTEYASWPVRDDDVIELIADRESYEVGDVAEVLVPAPFAGATGLVTIERGRVRSAEVRRFETNSEVLRIPIEDDHIPNIYVGVVLYRPADRGRPLPALPRRLRQSLRLHGAAPPRRQHPARPGRGPARRDRRLRGAGHGLGGQRGGGRRLRRRRGPGGALAARRGGAGRHGRVLVRARPRRADLLIARGLDRPAQCGLP